MSVETGGNCDARGKSGEQGCLQYLPSTWAMWSKEVLGYVPEMTKTNELYVATKKIQRWMDSGYDVEEIACLWNSGTPTHKRGVNKYGVPYDTFAYAQAVIKHL